MWRRAELPRARRWGVKGVAGGLGGVAFLWAYTSGGEMEGDLSGWHSRSKGQYRAAFTSAGLVGCGVHCYLNEETAQRGVELELV